MEQIKRLLEREQALTWIFTGDSITHGAAHTIGWRDYTELFCERAHTVIAPHLPVAMASSMKTYRTGPLPSTQSSSCFSAIAGSRSVNHSAAKGAACWNGFATGGRCASG